MKVLDVHPETLVFLNSCTMCIGTPVTIPNEGLSEKVSVNLKSAEAVIPDALHTLMCEGD